MKTLLSALVVALVLFGFLGFFNVLDRVKRARERKVTEVGELARKELSVEHRGAGGLEAIATWVAARHGRVTHRSDTQLIAFIGEGGGMIQFRGINSFRPSDMPLRVVAWLEGQEVVARVDEDFGWNLFVGPAKHTFRTLYAEALREAADQISAQSPASI